MNAITSTVGQVPLPRLVARINKRFTNRFIEPVVARFAGYMVVSHTGRRSSSPFRTPLFGFAGGDHVFVALTYGPKADWVQNVLASGGTIEQDGRTLAIASCQVVQRDLARPYLPLPVRFVLRALRVTDFMQLSLN